MLLLTPSLSNTAPAPATSARLLEHDWNWAQVIPYQTRSDFASSAHGCGPQATWPNDASVVLIVPPQRLSWHRVHLPKVPARKRLAALHGLLEEALLDDPEQLHFALPPAALAASGRDGLTWVAACDRAWLTACLSALRAAGRPATRICPAFPPVADAAQCRLWVNSETGSPWLHLAGPEGLLGLPLAAFTTGEGLLASLLSAVQGKDRAQEPASAPICTATPDAMATVQAVLPDRPWTTEPMAQQWQRGVNSGWDLAQFDLRDAMGARRGQALLEWLRPLWQAPRWRPLRWGLAALFAVQVVGLHLQAWQERAALRQLRADTQRIAAQTFPQLTVVLDAPRQMQRELDVLRHGAGELGPADLESLLHALGADPALSGLQMDSLRYTPREARLRHAAGAPIREALTAVATRQGWSVQTGAGTGTNSTSGQAESVLKRN